MKEEAQRQAGFDGEIRVLPLPTPSTASLRLPRGNGVWGQPHGDVASLDKGPLVGRPVADVIFRFVFRMDPRLHHLIVCCRPYPGRVANRSFWDRAGQLCTNAAPQRQVTERWPGASARRRACSRPAPGSPTIPRSPRRSGISACHRLLRTRAFVEWDAVTWAC